MFLWYLYFNLCIFVIFACMCVYRERERAFYLILNILVLKLIFQLVAVNISVIYFYSSKYFYLFVVNLLFYLILSVENDFDWL